MNNKHQIWWDVGGDDGGAAKGNGGCRWLWLQRQIIRWWWWSRLGDGV